MYHKIGSRTLTRATCTVALIFGWLAAPGLAAATTVGVMLPQGQLAANSETSESLRQSLLSQLRSQSVEAVPLTAASGAALEAEAQSKHCDQVLYTRVEKKSSGSGGMLSGLGGLSKVAGALPFGALAGRGGSSSMVGAAMQQAASAAGSTAAQQMMSGSQQMAAQTTATALNSLKQGDTVTVDYRLQAVGSANAVKAETLSGKADSDGQDVVGPLLAQTARAVAGTAPGPVAGSAAPATGHASPFGGLFGHRTAAAAAQAGAPAGGIDCNNISSMASFSTPGAGVSVADCQKMQAAQQTYAQAAAAGARPGDESMTCEQITAELHQQQFSAPDKDKVAAASATVAQEKSNLQHAQAVLSQTQAQDQAMMNAASAADTATELASGGLARGHSLDAAQKAVNEHDAAVNAQLSAEMAPTHQAMQAQVAGFGADAAAQMQSNPRLARLMQLANSMRCKGGG